MSANTRARVQAEAARIGYRPSTTARQLRKGRSEAIGVVLPNRAGQFDDPFFLRLLTGIGMNLARLDLDLLVTAASPGADEMRAFRRMVEGRRVDGFIIGRTRRHDARIGYLLDQGIPFVAHGRTEESRPYAFLDVDGHAAFRAATERLIDFGHRRIGLLNAPPGYMFAHHRLAGWREALAAAGLPDGPLEAAEPTEENGFWLAGQMLVLPDPPTALLCATDRLAAGALHALSHAGLVAGRDVSVIGYDNLPASICTNPPLTTMDQMVDRAAERLVEMLAALLGGAAPGAQSEIWQASLIARGSDGPRAAGPNQTAPQSARDSSQQSSGGTHGLDTATD